MRILQALRRSIKGDKEKPQISIAQKNAVAIVPPKKVSSCPSLRPVARQCLSPSGGTPLDHLDMTPRLWKVGHDADARNP